jgi:PIN domain nuclease of toxin-antitoxin system
MRMHTGIIMLQIIFLEKSNRFLSPKAIDSFHIHCRIGLPDIHRDPIDRFIIAEAIITNSI